jgi:hypothetical protein
MSLTKKPTSPGPQVIVESSTQAIVQRWILDEVWDRPVMSLPPASTP